MKKFFVIFIMIGLIFSISHIADAQPSSVTLDCTYSPSDPDDPSCLPETYLFSAGTYTISVSGGAIYTMMLQGTNLNMVPPPYGWFWGMSFYEVVDPTDVSTDIWLGELGDYTFLGSSNTNDGVYSSASDALNAREVSPGVWDSWSITLSSATNIKLIIDDPDRDNGGSLIANIAVVPEPISSILFLVGGSTLAARRFMRRKK